MQLRERRHGDAQPKVGANSAAPLAARRTNAVMAAAAQAWPGADAGQVLPLAGAASDAAAASLTSCMPPARRGVAGRCPRSTTPATPLLATPAPALGLCLLDTDYLSFPSGSSEDADPLSPEHSALLRTLSDDKQHLAPARLFADLLSTVQARHSMPLGPLPSLEQAPDWDHLLFGTPEAKPTPSPLLGAGDPKPDSCDGKHSSVSSSGGHSGRARRRRGAASCRARAPRGGAVAKASRKGLGSKRKAERLDFGRPKVQAFLRHLTTERRLSLQNISLALQRQFGCGRYSRFHLSKICMQYGIPTANGKSN
ncbi:hypothetical protein ABPG75_003454 [Micractinium tetrahymenae]